MNFLSFLFMLMAFAGAVEPAQVLKNVQLGKAVLIDVREPEEVAEGTIKGAKTFPSSKMNTTAWVTFMKTLPKEKTIYTYCAAGGRAELVAEALRAKGYKVENAGGYDDLAKAQKP